MTNSSLHLRRNFWWVREPTNPVLPPGEPGSFDSTSCMNPNILRKGDTYYLYYAGADDAGHRRICLATALVADPTHWQRHGPLFEIGDPGSFDARWCVLPHVVQMAPDRWHLYYTANSGVGKGLSAFPGIGLAISTDGKQWHKYDQNPILTPTGKIGDPDAMGIAGGSVIQAKLPDGTSEWRFYYTGCPTLGDDLFLDQQKSCCLAVSQDGIYWERRGAILLRDPEHDYENVAAAGPVVLQEDDGSYRMWYSAIGTRWGAYSIAYAESEDGYTWRRGAHYGDNLQLGPIGNEWERQMVEYPSVIQEGNQLRLFYCGYGYGASGTGTALSTPLRATLTDQLGEVDIVAAEGELLWRYALPTSLRCAEGTLAGLQPSKSCWHGPDAKGMLWYEWDSPSPEGGSISDATHRSVLGLEAIQCRIMLTPILEGLEVRVMVRNGSNTTLHDVCLPSRYWPISSSEKSQATLSVSWVDESAVGASSAEPASATLTVGDIAAGETYSWCGTIHLARSLQRS